MRPTSEKHIILEGALEARVAAQLLTSAGRGDLLRAVTPPIDQPSIGRFEFIVRLAMEQRGLGDDTEYTCPSPTNVEILQVLTEEAKLTPRERPTLSRKRYMGQRLITLAEQLFENSPLVLGSVVILQGSEEDLRLLRQRELFLAQYSSDRGWDAQHLSPDQLHEIQQQPCWINPPEIA